MNLYVSVCEFVCVSLKLIIVDFRARLSMIVSTTYGIPFLFVSVHCRDASLHSTFRQCGSVPGLSGLPLSKTLIN